MGTKSLAAWAALLAASGLALEGWCAGAARPPAPGARSAPATAVAPGKHARPPLLASAVEAVKQGTHPLPVRLASLRIVQDLGRAAGLAQVASVLADRGEALVLRRALAGTLGVHGSDAGDRALLGVLADAADDATLRVACLASLGRRTPKGIDPVLERIASHTEDPLRGRAAAALARRGRGGEALLPVLAHALRKAGPAEERAEAAIGLGHCRTKAAVPVLIEALGDRSPSVRDAARDALVGLCLEVHGTTAAAWRAWWREKGETFEVLRAEPASAPRLAAKLGPEEDPRVRAAAVRLLRQIGPAAAAPVAAALQEGRAGPSAVDVLAVSGATSARRLAALLSAKDETVAAHAAATLGDLGSAAVAPLRGVLTGRGRSLRARALAADALGRIGDASAVRDLLAAARSRDSRVCLAAVRALGRLGGAEANLTLLSLLGSEDAGRRAAAGCALAGQGARAVPALGAVLLDPKNPLRMRLEAARALERVHGPAAATPLTRALGLGTPAVRVAALDALGQRREGKTLGAVLAAAADETPTVRVAACLAAARIGRGRAVKALRAALADPDGRVREGALDGLAMTGDPRARALLRDQMKAGEAPWRSRAARALAGTLGPEDEAQLIELARHEDPSVRRTALRGLGKLRSRGAQESVARAAADSDPGVRRAALAAAAAGRTPAAADLLARALADRDPTVAAVARGSLPTLGRTLAVPALLRALEAEATRGPALTALRALTGRAFDDNPDTWRQWWTKQSERR